LNLRPFCSEFRAFEWHLKWAATDSRSPNVAKLPDLPQEGPIRADSKEFAVNCGKSVGISRIVENEYGENPARAAIVLPLFAAD